MKFQELKYFFSIGVFHTVGLLSLLSFWVYLSKITNNKLREEETIDFRHWYCSYISQSSKWK